MTPAFEVQQQDYSGEWIMVARYAFAQNAINWANDLCCARVIEMATGSVIH